MLTVTEIKQEINHLSIDDKLLLIDELCNSMNKDLSNTESQDKKTNLSSLAAVTGVGCFLAGGMASGVATSSLVMTSPVVDLVVAIETAIKDFRKNLKKSKLSTIQKSENWKETKRQPTITKGDKTIDPTEFFGMWKEQPKNLADIRKKAWHRSGFNQ